VTAANDDSPDDNPDVELAVTRTVAAVDGDLTVVLCDLLTDGVGACPGCARPAVYREIRSCTA
jgi:hypothetical protein